MIQRESYNRFSPIFLERHKDILRQDLFHHVLAYLLFIEDSHDEHFRQKTILTLGLDYYHKAVNTGKKASQLDAIKLILQIPDSTYLADHYEDCYPLWLIQANLKERIENGSFRMVDKLGWTMLEMSKAYYSRYHEHRASLTETLRLTLGEKPLKSGDRRKNALAGDKSATKIFKKYKSVCHFIMAFEYMRRGECPIDEGRLSDEKTSFNIDTQEQVSRFLNLSAWFRRELRVLVRPNVKDPALFPESNLLSLPEWVTCDGVDILVKPHAQKLQEIEQDWGFTKERYL